MPHPAQLPLVITTCSGEGILQSSKGKASSVCMNTSHSPMSPERPGSTVVPLMVPFHRVPPEIWILYLSAQRNTGKPCCLCCLGPPFVQPVFPGTRPLEGHLPFPAFYLAGRIWDLWKPPLCTTYRTHNSSGCSVNLSLPGIRELCESTRPGSCTKKLVLPVIGSQVFNLV